MKFLIAIILLSVSIASAKDEDMETLAQWLSGTFSNSLQSTKDSSYMDLRLQVKRVWPERSDGYWFLYDQSSSATPELPLIQRVYHVRRVEENMIEGRLFAWKNPQSVVGALADSSITADKTPLDLIQKRGCEIYLQLDGFAFTGGTHGTACAGDSEGASYSTKVVSISSKRIESWDRGFGADGSQKWGAVQGPYVFIRQ